jgi:Flp pilus assembly pilin Flp
MIRLFRGKKGQNTAEYALLIALVVAAIIAMQEYAKRALQARVRDASVFMTNTTGNGDVSVNGFPTTTQYTPYYEERDHQVTRDTTETDRLGQGLVAKESATTRTRTGSEKTTYQSGSASGAPDTSSEMPSGL